MCLCECNVFPEEIRNLQLITLKHTASDETVPFPSLRFSVHHTCQCCVCRRIMLQFLKTAWCLAKFVTGWFMAMVVSSPWLPLAPQCISIAHLVLEMLPTASSLSTDV
jgi:hypothetical protein